MKRVHIDEQEAEARYKRNLVKSTKNSLQQFEFKRKHRRPFEREKPTRNQS